MTVVVSGDSSSVAGSGPPLSSRSTSRSKATGMRFSTSKVRQGGGSSHGGAGTSTLGGHPLSGPDANAPKMDIKHRFEITAKLGSGTYGKVSLAYDHKMEREVAVKLIKKSAIENKQDLVRIRREIRIMSMLKHPNIIQIYEVFENKDKIILVMEYASGGELYDYVSKFGSLPESEARRIFRQITSAVLYCHKHKVAHRDLKLENILLDANNNAKIADFGLSNYFNEKNLLTTFCGSPLYASPEIINGTPYKGPEVDCWSLGILLYTLVYGSMPFDGRDFNRMVRQIKRGAYYEPDAPSTASMLVRNMLRVNPDRRADIDDIASHWWLNLEENMPVIQELPENQITDHTPLTERAEIMVVQDLADETDVFMEFGHLSHATRQKIEEFRRRRKEAEEYNENSPIKPPKTRRTSNAKEENAPEMTSKEKSLRHQEDPPRVAATSIIPSEVVLTGASKEKSMFQDPLERLRQLESRLQGGRQMQGETQPKQAAESKPETVSAREEKLSKYAAQKSAKTEQDEKRMSQVKEVSVESSASDRRKSSADKGRVLKDEKKMSEPKSPTKSKGTPLEKEERHDTANDASTSADSRRPTFVSPTGSVESHNSHSGGSQKLQLSSKPAVAAVAAAIAGSSKHPSSNPQYWRMEVDSLNVLMNQVLEQMESRKGQVSMNLVGRIKAHPMYDERPMVKELLESILAAQPIAVQKEASKVIQQQQSQATIVDSVKKPAALPDVVPNSPKAPTTTNVKSPTTKTVKADQEKSKIAELPSDLESKKAALRKTILEERPWHSVEVGFSTDDDSSSNNTDAGSETQPVAAKFTKTRLTRSEPYEDEYEDEDEFYDAEEDEEEYESDIDELAEVVENVTKSSKNVPATGPPKIVENLAESAPSTPMVPQPPAEMSKNHLSATLERGLAKRQSKGKYQFLHNQIEMYGRGVSMEAESPPPSKRRIGGPQPRPEHSPILFDKAKTLLMNPEKVNEVDIEEQSLRKKRKNKDKPKDEAADAKKWLKTQDSDIGSTNENEQRSNSVTPIPIRLGSVPPRTPPPIGKSAEKESEEEEMSDEEEEEEEESDAEAPPFRPRPSTIIGFRTIQPIGSDGVRKEAPIVQVKPQTSSGQVSSATNSQSKKVPSTLEKQEQKPQKTAAVSNTRTPRVAREPPTPTSLPAQNSTPKRKNSRETTATNNKVTVFPVIEQGNDEEEAKDDGRGMQKYETAASYIRRKNRERRARNKTIAVTSDDLHSASRMLENVQDGSQSPAKQPLSKSTPTESAILRRKSSLSGTAGVRAASISEHRGTSTEPSQANASPSLGYHRQSYLDERRSSGAGQHQFEPNYSRQTYVDRRKSFQEFTPSRDSIEERCLSPFSSGAYEKYGIGNYALALDAAPLPASNLSRYEDEVFNAFYPATNGLSGQSWTNEPHRFEVYRTRAERAADFNYRPGAGSHFHTENHRPASAYIPGLSYRSRYDGDHGNYTTHRRSFYDGITDPQRPITPNNELGATTYAPAGVAPPDSPEGRDGSGGIFSRFRPVTRRLVGTALRDVDGRRARSQSNDHMYSTVLAREDAEFASQIGARMMTPDMGLGSGFERSGAAMEYGYVNYHDSSGRGVGVAAQPPDMTMTPARSILKNRQAFEVEPRGKETTSGGILSRLRRHLSTDENKNASPTMTTYGYDALKSLTNAPPPLYSTNVALEGIAATTNATLSGESGKGKRSLLNMARRRTAEVRMLPDGKISTNSYLDDEPYKRPRSPIDRIKSLFRGKSKDNATAGSVVSQATGSSYTPVSTTYGASSRFAAPTSSYQPVGAMTQSPNSQYKRYTGAATTMNRGYGYPTTGNGTTRNNWYDGGPHLY
ncbi:protein kinase domain-containing protein [Ditylenchus destructor]|uniref:Protein kinase domain-containing protein n=1 Tax=Ditylenchus destructor TaxID=166010 RepID=A0AAD4N6V5_9BILA|nr:protein kinase domain-containing protein [Ditylenchus destructor]